MGKLLEGKLLFEREHLTSHAFLFLFLFMTLHWLGYGHLRYSLVIIILLGNGSLVIESQNIIMHKR